MAAFAFDMAVFVPDRMDLLRIARARDCFKAFSAELSFFFSFGFCFAGAVNPALLRHPGKTLQL